MFTVFVLALVGSALADFVPLPISNDALLPPVHLPRGFASAPVFSPKPAFLAPLPIAAPTTRNLFHDVPVFKPVAPVFAPVNRAFVPTPFVRHPTNTVLERTELSDDNGQFSSSFKASDGSTFTEIGKLRPTNDHKDKVVVKEGSYSYVSPEGIPVHISYTADEYGFHPTGTVLPVAQPILPPTF